MRVRRESRRRAKKKCGHKDDERVNSSHVGPYQADMRPITSWTEKASHFATG